MLHKRVRCLLSTVKKWESLEDDLLSGRSTVGNTEKNFDLKETYDRRLTLHEISNAISIPREKLESILHNELGKKNIFVLRLTRLLTPERKRASLITSRKNLTLFEADATLSGTFPNPGCVLCLSL